MPHIEIKCYPGRTEDVKAKCASIVAKDVAEVMGCNLSSVSVSITEVDKEDWKAEVWDKSIAGEPSNLYVKPGYTCD